MEFGSTCALCDISDEREDIYKDEVEDGIAACAESQAKVWIEAAKEQKFSGDFIEQLIELTSTYSGKEKGAQSRLQPRQADAKKFDEVSSYVILEFA